MFYRALWTILTLAVIAIAVSVAKIANKPAQCPCCDDRHAPSCKQPL